MGSDIKRGAHQHGGAWPRLLQDFDMLAVLSDHACVFLRFDDQLPFSAESQLLADVDRLVERLLALVVSGCRRREQCGTVLLLHRAAAVNVFDFHIC